MQGATPPKRVAYVHAAPSMFTSSWRVRFVPQGGSLPAHLSLREGSDSGLIIGGAAKTKWRQIALVGGGPKASMGAVWFLGEIGIGTSSLEVATEGFIKPQYSVRQIGG